MNLDTLLNSIYPVLGGSEYAVTCRLKTFLREPQWLIMLI